MIAYKIDSPNSNTLLLFKQNVSFDTFTHAAFARNVLIFQYFPIFEGFLTLSITNF